MCVKGSLVLVLVLDLTQCLPQGVGAPPAMLRGRTAGFFKKLGGRASGEEDCGTPNTNRLYPFGAECGTPTTSRLYPFGGRRCYHPHYSTYIQLTFQHHKQRSRPTRGGNVRQQTTPANRDHLYPDSLLFVSADFLPLVSSQRQN